MKSMWKRDIILSCHVCWKSMAESIEALDVQSIYSQEEFGI